MYVVTVKSMVEISQNFVAFSEYMNFNTSADFVLISVENDHIFEQKEDRATVILKRTDFR